MTSLRPLAKQAGALMIEVLVTISIIIIGLWGLLEVQTRLQVSEMESYQRTQALMLLDDMASRIATNRPNAAAYVGDDIGVSACSTTVDVTDPLVDRDEAEWCRALQGAAEKTVADSSVGSLIGGRGCVESVGLGGVEEYLVTVAWQGKTPISVPPANVDCGVGQYNLPAGSDCANKPDTCRRFVTTLVRISDLTDF